MMNIKPILFSTPMVQAIIDGRKTQTRRVMKPQPCPEATEFMKFIHTEDCGWEARFGNKLSCAVCDRKPPIFDGDILWVRETWNEGHDGFVYRANIPDTLDKTFQWRPCIHMPKAAARLFLRVTDVRVERLQEITNDDAKAEGVLSTREQVGLKRCAKENPLALGSHKCPDGCNCFNARENFAGLWDEIYWNKQGTLRDCSWDANPWVWVYTFERCEKPDRWPGV